MNALRLVSQKRASKSSGSTSSDKSPTSPKSENSPKSPPPKSQERDPSPQEKQTAESFVHSEKPTPHTDSKKEKAEIDIRIDPRSNATNTESCTRGTPVGTHRVSQNHLPGSDRELASLLDSDVENDSGLDLSLDQHALGKQSTSVSERSSQDSADDGRHELLVDAEIKTNSVSDEDVPREGLLSGDKDAQTAIDTNSVTSSQTDKSDISVCSDVSDTSGSDQGVNMDRYLFDPSKGVKNQAAKWEGRTSSPDRRANKSKGGQAPPQQAPVFRQKFRHCEVAVGSEARFECRVDGHPSPDIIWFKNGKRMQEGERYSITKIGEDVHCLVVKKVTRDEQGTFMCEARSPAGKARCSARLVVQHRKYLL